MVSNVSIFESKAYIFLPWLLDVLSCFLPTVCAIPKKGINSCIYNRLLLNIL